MEAAAEGAAEEAADAGTGWPSSFISTANDDGQFTIDRKHEDIDRYVLFIPLTRMNGKRRKKASRRRVSSRKRRRRRRRKARNRSMRRGRRGEGGGTEREENEVGL